jgi:hypothetical protein
VQHDTPGADPVAEPQRAGERRQRLGADLVFQRGAVDQVDGVDHHRVDRRALESGAELRHVVVRIGGGAPRPRVLVEDLDRLTAAVDPALNGAVQPARCGNMRPDQH